MVASKACLVDIVEIKSCSPDDADVPEVDYISLGRSGCRLSNYVCDMLIDLHDINQIYTIHNKYTFKHYLVVQKEFIN